MKVPKVSVVAGGHDFLRSRAARKLLSDAIAQGYSLGEASDFKELQFYLEGNVFAGKTIVLVNSGTAKKARKKKGTTSDTEQSGWNEDAVQVIVDHHKGGDDDVSLVVVHPGDMPAGSLAGMLAEKLPKSAVKNYPAPKPWEEKDQAVKFLTVEMERRGKSVGHVLAETIIGRCGSDLGVVSYEALKFSTYLDAVGRTELLSAEAGSLVAGIGAGDWEVLRTALARRDGKGVLKTFEDLRARSPGDIVPIALAVLLPAVTSWLHASSLVDQGSSPEEAAEILGMHPYRYNNFVLPAAVAWGTIRLSGLLRAISEIAPNRGFLDPGLALEAVLVIHTSGPRR